MVMLGKRPFFVQVTTESMSGHTSTSEGHMTWLHKPHFLTGSDEAYDLRDLIETLLWCHKSLHKVSFKKTIIFTPNCKMQ